MVKYEYKSSFANDIIEMLKFRETLGFDKRPYSYNLLLFDAYCVSKFPNVFELTQELVISWLNYESNGKYRSIEVKSVNIRYFGQYLLSLGKNAFVLASGYGHQKVSFSPYIFTHDELRRLFTEMDNLVPKKCSPLQHHLVPVVFRLIYTCGLRPNEGRDLMRKDINLKNGEILIRKNKKHKERMIVMSEDMLKLCNEYEKQRLIYQPNSEYFFPSPKGIPYRNPMMLYFYNTCWYAANPDVRAEDLRSVRVYDLRHRFASATINRWLDEGKDIHSMLPFLRAYMGHDNIESTLYYVQLLPENLAKSSGVDWETLNSLLPEAEE